MLKELPKAGEIKISNEVLNAQYQKNWIVYFSKPTCNVWHTISYFTSGMFKNIIDFCCCLYPNQNKSSAIYIYMKNALYVICFIL